MKYGVVLEWYFVILTIFHHDLNIEEDSFKQFPSNEFLV